MGIDHVPGMRRKDKQITDPSQLADIIKKSVACRIAMCDGDKPYMVPMSFGFDGDTLYFHTSKKGYKLDILKKNPNVCFEFDIEAAVMTAEKACEFSINYKSIIGFGSVVFIEDPAEKKAALDIIVSRYADVGKSWPMSDKAVSGTIVFKINIHHMTGKQS